MTRHVVTVHLSPAEWRLLYTNRRTIGYVNDLFTVVFTLLYWMFVGNFMLIPVFIFKSNNTASEQGEQELCVIYGCNTTLCWSICCVGASRGFAFVEFNTLQEASQWMEMKQVSCRLTRLLSQLRELVRVANPVCPKTCIIVIHTVVSGLSHMTRELVCSAALCRSSATWWLTAERCLLLNWVLS